MAMRLRHMPRGLLIDTVREHVSDRFQRRIDEGNSRILGLFSGACREKNFVVVRVTDWLLGKRRHTYLAVGEHLQPDGSCRHVAGQVPPPSWDTCMEPGPRITPLVAGRLNLKARRRRDAAI